MIHKSRMDHKKMVNNLNRFKVWNNKKENSSMRNWTKNKWRKMTLKDKKVNNNSLNREMNKATNLFRNKLKKERKNKNKPNKSNKTNNNKPNKTTKTKTNKSNPLTLVSLVSRSNKLSKSL